MKIKKLIFCSVYACILTLCSTFLIYIILKNIDDIGSIFTDNEIIIGFLKNLTTLKIRVPIEMIFVFFALFLLNSILLYKKRIVFVIVSVVLIIVFLVVLFLLSKYGEYFVFQIINNLKESLYGKK